MFEVGIQKHKIDAKRRIRVGSELNSAFGDTKDLIVIYFEDHLEIISEGQYSEYKNMMYERIGDKHIARLFLAGKCEKFKADKQGRFQIPECRKENFKEEGVYVLKVDNDTYNSVEVYPQSVYEKIVQIGTFAENQKEPKNERGQR